MNADEVLRDWIARRRGVSPPTDLTDRIMAALPAETVLVPTEDCPSPRQRLWSRIGTGLLVCTATVVLMLRIYSTVSVIATPMAMDADEIELRKGRDEQRLASRS